MPYAFRQFLLEREYDDRQYLILVINLDNSIGDFPSYVMQLLGVNPKQKQHRIQFHSHLNAAEKNGSSFFVVVGDPNRGALPYGRKASTWPEAEQLMMEAYRLLALLSRWCGKAGNFPLVWIDTGLTERQKQDLLLLQSKLGYDNAHAAKRKPS
jgi:hypothetical protein